LILRGRWRCAASRVYALGVVPAQPLSRFARGSKKSCEGSSDRAFGGEVVVSPCFAHAAFETAILKATPLLLIRSMGVFLLLFFLFYRFSLAPWRVSLRLVMDMIKRPQRPNS